MRDSESDRDDAAPARRVARLERAVRLQAAAIVGLAGLWLASAGGQDAEPPSTSRAERFELVDAEGRVLARLAAEADGPVLALADEEGRDRVALVSTADERGLVVRDARGDVRVGALLFGHGGAGVAVHGPEVKGAAVLYAAAEPSVAVYGADGATLGRLPAAADEDGGR